MFPVLAGIPLCPFSLPPSTLTARPGLSSRQHRNIGTRQAAASCPWRGRCRNPGRTDSGEGSCLGHALRNTCSALEKMISWIAAALAAGRDDRHALASGAIKPIQAGCCNFPALGQCLEFTADSVYWQVGSRVLSFPCHMPGDGEYHHVHSVPAAFYTRSADNKMNHAREAVISRRQHELLWVVQQH